MTEWILKKMGIGGEMLQHLDRAQLAFQNQAILWIGLILLIPIGFFIVRRQKSNLGTVPVPLRIALSCTRIFTLAMLIGVLSGPYLKIDHKTENKPILAVLFDQSLSMKLPAAPFASNTEIVKVATAAGYQLKDGKLDAKVRQALNKISRANLALDVVKNAQEKVFKPLEEKYDVRYYTFSRNLNQMAGLDEGDPVANGNATHLGDAISKVLSEAAGRQISGLIMFTDGQNTGGRSPAEAISDAQDAKVPIFSVPVGPTQRVADVAIVDVYTSGLVAQDDTVRVAVTIESQGLKNGEIVKIELRQEGEQKPVDTKEIRIRNTEQQQIELSFKAKSPGPQLLHVTIPPLKEEAEYLHQNNKETAYVRVTADRLRVLYIEGRPGWTFRFLKNAMRRDKGLADRKGENKSGPDIVVETEWRRWKKQDQVAALPKKVDELAKYHTIILGDVSPKMLDKDLRRAIDTVVREKGVGLLVAAGIESMPQKYDSQFQELLPVRMINQSDGHQAAVYNPYTLELTPDGLIHESMRLYDDAGRNQNVWRNMPPYFWCSAAAMPSAGATVLAWNPSVATRFGKLPLIAYHYAGDGKVFFVGTDSTWNWRQNVGDRFFYRFWGQSIRFVARNDEIAAKKNWVEVRPFRTQPGEVAEIELFAFRPDGTPHQEQELAVQMMTDGDPQQVQLSLDPNKPGRYRAKFTPKTPVLHKIRYQPTDGSNPVLANLQVVEAPEEYRYPHLNRQALATLSGSTEGKVVELVELDQIPDRLKGKATLKEVKQQASIWDNWLTLLLLMVVYSVDVGIRRLSGLS